MNKEYWTKFYSKKRKQKQSSFAEFCLPYIKGNLVDMGCGSGRDLYYFLDNKIKCHGVDESNKDKYMVSISVKDYMKSMPSPKNVYTRFFWHAITRKEQLDILKWVDGTLFIEARTTEDTGKKVFGNHERNLVDVKQLVKDLKVNGFEILYLKEGRGMSKFKGEDPHLVRVIAKR